MVQASNKYLVQSAANLVPFLVKILEAFEPAMTDAERQSLGRLGFGELPEGFRYHESRTVSGRLFLLLRRTKGIVGTC